MADTENEELLAMVKEDHLKALAFYKAMGLEKMFYATHWDGFTSFEDYAAYGDMFPFIEIDEDNQRFKRIEGK